MSFWSFLSLSIQAISARRLQERLGDTGLFAVTGGYFSHAIQACLLPDA
jgi:hypothetical protein